MARVALDLRAVSGSPALGGQIPRQLHNAKNSYLHDFMILPTANQWVGHPHFTDEETEANLSPKHILFTSLLNYVPELVNNHLSGKMRKRPQGGQMLLWGAPLSPGL